MVRTQEAALLLHLQFGDSPFPVRRFLCRLSLSVLKPAQLREEKAGSSVAGS